MFQQQSRATFHSSSRFPLPPLSYVYFLIRLPYLSTPSVCFSLFFSFSVFFLLLFFFFYFLSRSLSRRIFFAEAFRGDSRNNEWTWKRDGQSYSCSLAGAHLPPVRLACSFGGRGREREREEEKVSRSRFIPTSLHAVFVSYSIPSPAPRFVLFMKWSINICCLIAWKGNGFVLSSAKTERDDSEILFRYVREGKEKGKQSG